MNQASAQLYCISLIGPSITKSHVEHLQSWLILHGFDEFSQPENLHETLCGGLALDSQCVQLYATGARILPPHIHEQLLDTSDSLGIDIILRPQLNPAPKHRLAVFDMDSTLIQAEVIDELAKLAGIGHEVALITASAMRGEIDFNTSFRERVKLLKGLEESALEQVASSLILTPGTERLFMQLHKMGVKTAILSGGFDFFTHRLQKQLSIDFVYSNSLDIAQGKVTGKVVGTIVDGQRKAELLRSIATKLDVALSDCVAVGDGANDLPMLNLAGLGVAFHAKPKVRQRAKTSISHTAGLDSLLYLLR